MVVSLVSLVSTWRTKQKCHEEGRVPPPTLVQHGSLHSWGLWRRAGEASLHKEPLPWELIGREVAVKARALCILHSLHLLCSLLYITSSPQGPASKPETSTQNMQFQQPGPPFLVPSLSTVLLTHLSFCLTLVSVKTILLYRKRPIVYDSCSAPKLGRWSTSVGSHPAWKLNVKEGTHAGQALYQEGQWRLPFCSALIKGPFLPCFWKVLNHLSSDLLSAITSSQFKRSNSFIHSFTQKMTGT